MATAAKKTQSKPQRKNPYPNAKKFTNDELLSIIDAFNTKLKSGKTPVTSYMSFDIKNESQTEGMKKNGVRYLTVLITDLEGKVRPLVRNTAACVTRSKCKPGKVDEGKKPSKFSYSTRILIPYELGAKHRLEKAEYDERYKQEIADAGYPEYPEDGIITQEWVDAVINYLADDTVNKKFPDLPEDQFDAMATQQAALLKAEYKQWLVEMRLDAEFRRLLSSKDVRAEIKWGYKPKDHKIQGNVQYARTVSEDKPEDMALANSDGEIPLDEPMVYHGIRIDTSDGSLWCRIYDVTKPVKGGKRVLATAKNPENGKMEFLSDRTLEDWLRPNSVVAGIEAYQLCLHGKGASMHVNDKELLARRAAKSEAQSQVDEETESQMALFGGQFACDDDEDEDGDDTPAAPKPAGAKEDTSKLTGVEAQFAALRANAPEDD